VASGVERAACLIAGAMLLALFAAGPVQGGVVRYVKHDATGAQTGATWSDAFTLMEPALQAAESGDEIWIAAGTYKPTNRHGFSGESWMPLARFVHFRMKNGVAIYGGFAGTEELLGQRNPAANPVILSGDLGVAGDAADNCYHVFYHPSELALDATAVLDGVTVSGGNADDRAPQDAGAAMYNYGCSPTIVNCRFTGNGTAAASAVYAVSSAMTLTGCAFTGNAGRGVECRAGAAVLRDCVLSGNGSAGLQGVGATTLTVSGCDFRNNGGAGLNLVASSATVTNSIFWNNRLSGIRTSDSGATLQATNCVLVGNDASTGGGLYCSFGNATLTNCVVWSNTATVGTQVFKAESGAFVSMNYCVVQGGWAGTGNVNADPLFVDAAGGDFRLRACSPCIDAADTTPAPATDMAGNARRNDAKKVDTGTGPTPRADIGAFEFLGESPRVALSVTSTPVSGIAVTSTTGHGGTTGYVTSTMYSGAPVILVAPEADPAGLVFARWEINGLPQPDGVKRVQLRIGADSVAVARYSGPVVFVKADATGANTGSSWSDAFTSLESALGAVAGGCEVWIAAGTYVPEKTHLSGVGDRYKHFRLRNNVGVYGGFAGTETLRSQAVPSANVVILSGEIGVPGDATDNCYHVFLHPPELGLNNTAVLDGVTITAGNAADPVPGASRNSEGGGMLNSKASPTLRRCTFSGNAAAGLGGALRLQDVERHDLTDCVFIHNRAGSGGAIGSGRNSSGVPWLWMMNCVLVGNSADYGGAIYGTETGMSNCVVSGNHAAYDGGASSKGGTFTGCTLSGNWADRSGGAIDGGRVEMYNTILWNNAAPTFAQLGPTVTLKAEYCLVQGGAPGAGNIDGDPLFVDAAAGNLRLKGGSPCIDAGRWHAPPRVDLDGYLPQDDTGKTDTGSGACTYADIGAYEFRGVTAAVTLAVRSAPVAGLDISSDTGHGGVTDYALPGLASGARVTLTVPAADPAGLAFARWEVNGVDRSAGVRSVSFALGEDTTAVARYVPPVIYVKADATGADNGASWADAFTSLDRGLRAAVAGCEVWVAAGTYRPENPYGLGIGSRYNHFRLKNGVAVYGGFAGTETARAERDAAANVVRLSGDLGSAGVPSDNAYHVFYHPLELALDRTALLDGVTISDGNADGVRTGLRIASGGGMYNEGCSPSLTDCVFAGNNAGGPGGAIHGSNVPPSSPRLVGCVFTGNSAGSGGAVNGAVSAEFVRCAFQNNTARYSGGAIHDTVGATMTHCTFTGNVAGTCGGAVAMVSTGAVAASAYSNCVFTGNTAGTEGGAAYIASPGLRITDCAFADNRGGRGGALYVGFGRTPLPVVNCVFRGNSADRGGAVYVEMGALAVLNSTFYGNTADFLAAFQCVLGSTAQLTNCVLWGNGAPGRPQIYNESSDCVTTATWCNIQGGYPGEGNINVDPLFVDATAGDLRLGPGSPCIDAAKTEAAPLMDAAGNARRDDPGAPNRGTAAPWADMGAYEFQGVSPLPARLYVNDAVTGEAGALCSAAGDDANDGLSPNRPMRTIQALLDRYPEVGAGRTVWVDPGAYGENVHIAPSHAGLRLQGAGAANTVLDGGQLNTVIVAVNFGAGEISGFSLVNGRAAGATAVDKSGGGIRLQGPSTALISGCILRNNASAVGCGGGGIYVYNASPIIRNCLVVNNTGSGCGGIRTYNGAPTIVNCTVANNLGGGIHRSGTGTLAVTNCIVWGNGDDLTACAATYSCIQDGDAGTGNVSGNPMFLNPAAGDYRIGFGSAAIDSADTSAAPARDLLGAVRLDEPATPPNGQAYADMGAYEFQGSLTPATLYVNDDSTADDLYCTAAGDDANDGFSPGKPMRHIRALLAKYPAIGPRTLKIDTGAYAENLVITAAHAGWRLHGAGAENTALDGGGVNSVIALTAFGAGEIRGMTVRNGRATGLTSLARSGGGIRCYSNSNPLIAECIIRDNAAATGCGGGGVYAYASSPVIVNCLIVKNAGTGCGGVRTYGGAVTITNSTVANNAGGGIHRTGGGTMAVTNCIVWANGDDLVACGATYSCVQDGDAGEGNVSADPLFVDAAAGDYHLSGGSPCVDAGTPTGAPTTDLDGAARDATPDIGAYEAISGS
jgi:hypothetical protein